ncbi:RidA family protein [uncultured Flavonifractor sp.]|uniref:RidA family protein n=1 Tax=uncultured Flavonifractor sp. TaxID=1193534 RepID=UPI0026029C2B|nr:RidA family protein [uncultured Flavonifractor sp.]
MKTDEVDQMANEYIRFTDDMSAPYSDLVTVDGKFLFLSGLVSEDLNTGDLVYGTITEETCQVLDNLKVLLERHGSDMDHVVRIDVLLRDFAQRDEMNAEYVRHFDPKHMPARLCYGNVGLADQCKIEIAVTAVKA